ncbi:F-box/FBD/LRR-repeat protein At5g22700-like [Lotus japonicus]|uniref:F-box/FBD/LRR-repeat protein At5g22700-like n=1 Tax=Lotus japonicus TaxID=34305 RepID=UPI00258A9161|nr:F-box/FBD/LRR-repeat protein At5g22700-like [Lotus japonicus]
MNSHDDPNSEGAHSSSDDHTWQAAKMPKSIGTGLSLFEFFVHGLGRSSQHGVDPKGDFSPSREGNMDDRISSLPEELICHILSFLPTKQVVATSALSKNWKSLWRSVPTFYYIGNFRRIQEGFVQTVNAFIHSRDLHQPIHKFCLTFMSSGDDHSTCIREWVNAVMQRRVQHLELSISVGYPMKPANNIFPTIFTCRTLVILKLHFIDVKLLSTVDLPSLKVLHLILLDSGCLAPLLSGCPVLEDFQVMGPYNYFAKTEFKTLPKLVRADIFTWNTNFLLAVNNMEFLRIHRVLWFVHCSSLFVRKI